MKQIYNFDSKEPPEINASMLRAEIEKRRLRRQTTIAAVAGILIHIVLLFCAVLLAKEYLLLSFACVAYVIFSATGGTVIAIIINSSAGKRAMQQA